MTVVRTVSELRHFLASESCVGLVPTIGALHEGHLELIRRSSRDNRCTVVSVFVNPTQFSPNEDFSRYPRNEARDAELAESAGATVVFAPSIKEMYPWSTTWVDVENVSDSFEGEYRPGHFRGVATVVLKLFNIVPAHVAYFGLKDLQQCAVIRRMVEDLHVPYRLEFIETIRETDGLALSSRNQYLHSSDREIASRLYQELRVAADEIASGTEPTKSCARSVDRLEAVGFKMQYMALVDPRSMKPVQAANGELRIVAAGYLGSVRLIDNVPVHQ